MTARMRSPRGRSSSSAMPRTCGAAALPLRVGPGVRMDRRFRRCCLEYRGGRQRRNGNWESLRALHLAEAPGAARAGSRGLRGDRASRGRRAKCGALRAVGGRGPYNGLARYKEAAWSARQATSNTFEYWVSVWALPELVEAAMHMGDAELARDALEQLAETTQPAWTRLRAGHRGPLPGAPERRHRRQRLLLRSDRAV